MYILMVFNMSQDRFGLTQKLDELTRTRVFVCLFCFFEAGASSLFREKTVEVELKWQKK